jgi:hypothetical protein
MIASQKAISSKISSVKSDLESKIASDINAANALRYQGTIGSSGATITALPTDTSKVKVGDLYVVATAGNYAGQGCNVGDMIIATVVGTSSITWNVIESNMEGSVSTGSE